jgi:C1A family cysteine protease
MTTNNGKRLGQMGWERDLPDIRDYTPEVDAVKKVLAKSQPLRAAVKAAPKSIDLRDWCSSVEDQGDLGSCTANAGVGLLEYYEQRAFGKYLDGSRLFLYKATRNLLGWTGDEGAYLRDTMKAMVLFGVPPEKYWPYRISKFDEEPPAFCYAFAQSYQAILYYRLDPSGTSASQVLKNVKKYLAGGLPSMFGFSVYSSMPGIGDGSGEIPFPQPGDALEGGHAVVAVGYDDGKKIGKEKGALLIRNSWGEDWGAGGYGWLPYAYVEHGLAVDFWSLVQAEFVDTDLFKA